MRVDKPLVGFEFRDEAEALGAFHVAARAELQLAERPGLVVRIERRAVGENALVLEPGGPHRVRIETQVQQLDMVDVVLALEIGHDRGRECRSVEPRRIERRSETHRLPALERRAEQSPAAHLDDQPGQGADDSGIIFEQQIERCAAIARGKSIDPGAKMRHAMIGKAADDPVPIRELFRCRFAHA